MKSTIYPDHPAPVLGLRTVTYCTENEGTPTVALLLTRVAGDKTAWPGDLLTENDAAKKRAEAAPRPGGTQTE
jgi:hypothetical protein